MAAPPSPHFDRQVRSCISDSSLAGGLTASTGLSVVMSRQPDLSVCVVRRLAGMTNKSEPRGMTESDLAVSFQPLLLRVLWQHR